MANERTALRVVIRHSDGTIEDVAEFDWPVKHGRGRRPHPYLIPVWSLLLDAGSFIRAKVQWKNGYSTELELVTSGPPEDSSGS
jgi:hypothetical protein